MDKETAVLAAVSAECTADFQCTEKTLQSIQQQKELYPNDWIKNPKDSYYTPGGYFMDDFAIWIEALWIQLYCKASGAGIPSVDFSEYHNVVKPAYKHDSI